MSRVVWVLLVLLCCRAQADREVTLAVYPPDAEIRAFLPHSHPKQGDLLPNNVGHLVPDDTISFRTIISAPDYHTREYEAKLLSTNSVEPNRWVLAVRLEPKGFWGHLRDERHFHPTRFYGALIAVFAAMVLGSVSVRRRRRESEEALRLARVEVQQAKDALESVDPRLEGRTVDDYTVESLLGEGTFGKVYKVRHDSYGDLFAMKIFKPEALDKNMLDRVSREVMIGKDFSHPNLVRTFAFGTYRDAPYLVMEYVDGELLEDRIKRDGALPLESAIGMLRGLCAGLDYAHERGVIHRDLKPGNIFVTAGEQPKILDFGVSKLLDAEHRLTKTGEALGTPMYMSVEQMKGQAVVASDIYALGAIFFEMLTGQTVFQGVTAMEILSQHALKDPPLASSVNPTIPPELDNLLLGMLAKRIEDRIGTAKEVLSKLESLAT